MSLPESLTNVYLALLTDLDNAFSITLPRCYFDGVQGHMEQYSLHGFCEASNKAYCAVDYLVQKKDVGCKSNFVASKSRVVPLKKLTIPRLELIVALILPRNYPVQPSKSQLETGEYYQEIPQELTTLLAKNELKGKVNLHKILDVNKFSS